MSVFRGFVRRAYLAAHLSVPTTFACSIAHEAMPSEAGGTLSVRKAQALRAHLSYCGACRADMRNLRALAASLTVRGGAPVRLRGRDAVPSPARMALTARA